MTLAGAALQTIVCCSDLDRARTFYRDALGLPLLAERFNGAVFAVGQGVLWVCPATDYAPGPRTVFGFEVPDIAAARAELEALGKRILGPSRIGAHGTPVFFVHPKDMGGVLTEIMESPAHC